MKHIAYAEIELPVEILRRGFFFVDSPGLGSAISENTQTTEQFLPEADAFILVTSYESPLSEEEDRILHRIRLANKRLFVVLNKQDTVTSDEREQALRFVAERLEHFSFSEAPRIFSISARKALKAKQSESEDGLKDSEIQSFEEELLRFLTEERAQSFLSNMYGRTSTFAPFCIVVRAQIERLLRHRRSHQPPHFGGVYGGFLRHSRCTLRDCQVQVPCTSRSCVTASSDKRAKFRLPGFQRERCRFKAA